ncbi:GNAT family N-acetyltransferase [Asanoa siamensis]|uniref:N-acetyltransferase domain-containing protein n=1 Tax=Asanoa siamensis TaxID=926357 RepID=A0ABQ4D4V6_9ACTN|nr:GNAT family N-acetyltransferase [Asanoa siamensis]GIF78570.1 hypothetical protein Asi02nite_80880 [Asanoa siamensis]
MNHEAVTIRPAVFGDLKGITELARCGALDALPENESPANGFLVSGLSFTDYRDLLDRAEFFYVAHLGQELAGYLIAYSYSDLLRDDEWLSSQLAEVLDDFTIVKQVFISKNFRNQGIASALYGRVLAVSGSTNVVALVVAQPRNRASSHLHRKLGFAPATSVTPLDGLPRTVWVRLPRDSRMFQQQLLLAIDLYKHDDRLNWQKLNNFFYVTVGLVALCGLSLGFKDGSKNVVLLLTTLLGAASALAFTVTLSAGVFYLQYRKKAIKVLERLVELRGCPAVLFGRKGTTPRKGGILAKSPSNYVLVGIPAIALTGWTCGILAVCMNMVT